MIIDTRGIELNENNYINKAGKFLLKIEKWELGALDKTGADTFKIFFKGVEVGTKDPVYMHTEYFSTASNVLWRLKMLEVAIKSPEVYDIDDWVGRYVIASVEPNTYTKADGTSATSYQCKRYEYCTHNDKLPPIPEAKPNTNDDNGFNTADVDVDEDEIPF